MADLKIPLEMEVSKNSSADLENVPAHEIPDEPISRVPVRKRWRFTALGSIFDKTFPPHWTYFGFRRKPFLLVAAGIFIVLLALILGLSIGLTHRKATAIPPPSNGVRHTGDLTYYDPGIGACGVVSSSSDSIVAVSYTIYDAVQVGGNPNTNPLCGKQISATRFDGHTESEQSVIVTVVDRCTGCGPNDLDVSTSVFDQLANRASGRVNVTWVWLDV